MVNIVEEYIAKVRSRIFKDESKLSIEYVPPKLPHREEQLKRLVSYFINFVENPGSCFPKVIEVGDIGTGKTVCAKKFGQDVTDYAKKVGKPIKYVHVNCYKCRTLFLILQEVASQLQLPVPKRGFSTQELLKIILDLLVDKNLYVIITLDEVDSLLQTPGGEGALYTLVRVTDEYLGREHRIGLILISRDENFIFKLDPSVRSALQHNVIKFPPYTKAQIYDILHDRAEEAFIEGVVRPEILDMIAEISGKDTGGRGDARYAIEILWRAGKIAEVEGTSVILPDHVRKAVKDTLVSISVEELKSLKKHQLLLLLAVVRVLQRKRTEVKVPLSEVEAEYRMLCEEFGEKPRQHTQVWEYVQELKSRGILNATVGSKYSRGRTTLVGIMHEPLGTLEKTILAVLRGGDHG
ncbi:MAG: cell division control protein Cdc6 [Thermoprotei archaeon]|nr:MAG: cell division control protein Cdc6 [Thermoprotei archaeon]